MQPRHHKSSKRDRSHHQKHSHHHKYSHCHKPHSRRHKCSNRSESPSSSSSSSSSSLSHSSNSRSSNSACSSSSEPGTWIKKVPNEYVDSSWIEEPGQRGQCWTQINKNGKKVPNHTAIESLRLHPIKADLIKVKGHWFGRLHKFHYNPYTKDKTLLDKANRKIFARPWSQSGHGSNNLQYAIGLKDDRDYFNDICVR